MIGDQEVTLCYDTFGLYLDDGVLIVIGRMNSTLQVLSVQSLEELFNKKLIRSFPDQLVTFRWLV